jgi:hypothetical protein
MIAAAAAFTHTCVTSGVRMGVGVTRKISILSWGCARVTDLALFAGERLVGQAADRQQQNLAQSIDMACVRARARARTHTHTHTAGRGAVCCCNSSQHVSCSVCVRSFLCAVCVRAAAAACARARRHCHLYGGIQIGACCYRYTYAQCVRVRTDG